MEDRKNCIPIVDLFAGPGGLGEGFCSVSGDPFRILVSAEMDESAHQTLRLRAFYRILRRKGNRALRPYYRFCNGEAALPYDGGSLDDWNAAGDEALRLILGKEEDNKRLDAVLEVAGLGPDSPWVLIGGPPCQAYSLVGRSRNKGKDDYRPEEDHRHFLYREYLRIIQQYRPAVFVMENVKGILSSSVGGERIFHRILQDLADPDCATGHSRSRPGYRIHSLTRKSYFDRSTSVEDLHPGDFVIRAEEYGIPQARHRVILVGVREDLETEIHPMATRRGESITVAEALAGLPPLRSKLSKEVDSEEQWSEVVRDHFQDLFHAAQARNISELAAVFREYLTPPSFRFASGALRVPKEQSVSPASVSALAKWYEDRNLNVWLNHEARGHMASDLLRYAYASSFAKARRRSPKGHAEFDLLESLRPSHANWETGKFADRFRVQHAWRPATTVTSHISKDGHYFIHPDPAQCRSLTVREAARIQTFPDNYFFQGNRTQQYHQVGNAVSPLLAHQIAKVVENLIFGDRQSALAA